MITTRLLQARFRVVGCWAHPVLAQGISPSELGLVAWRPARTAMVWRWASSVAYGCTGHCCHHPVSCCSYLADCSARLVACRWQVLPASGRAWYQDLARHRRLAPSSWGRPGGMGATRLLFPGPSRGRHGVSTLVSVRPTAAWDLHRVGDKGWRTEGWFDPLLSGTFTTSVVRVGEPRHAPGKIACRPCSEGGLQIWQEAGGALSVGLLTTMLGGRPPRR